MKTPLCPVCASPGIETFLTREAVPVHQNLIMEDQSAARSITRGDLTLTVCTECGFVFNRTFDPTLLSYGAAYDNTQSCSTSFRAYLDELLHLLVVERGIRNCRIVEVGCGKGQFLRDLVTYPGTDNTGIGFDPSYVGPESDLNGRLRFVRSYYGPECADIPADVVVCRHVIEHVPDPLAMLRTVRLALQNSPQARVFFETPCVEWILRHQVLWDFFYEHCSLFTASSLTTVFEAAGFTVNSVRHVFGGQYLWLEAQPTTQTAEWRVQSAEFSDTRHPTPDSQIPALAYQFATAENRLKSDWMARLTRLRERGNVAVWGAGAKGVTFCNLVDPSQTLFDCVVDMNPNKQGRFLPGTGHKIVSVEQLTARGVTTAILMNPNYRAENESLLRETGLDIALVE
jgi:SAM-dependent methyltransferase